MNRDYRGSSRGSSRRGFASMDPEEQREIASMGGRAAHEYGTAHEWNRREAARAGHLGGMARWGSRHRRGNYQD
jgi:general stress protein YciG